MPAYAVFIEGLQHLDFADDLNSRVVMAAQRAINRTADRTRTDAARRISSQVNFPAQYLTPARGRLAVVKKASGVDLSAVIRGQFRPTSLAQFVQGSPGKRGSGVTVEVKPGFSRKMKRAFLIKLPQGRGSVETKFNRGLAIRLKPGETLENKKTARRMANGLYLLYGPSVNQVFRSVSEDASPSAAAFLEREFLRLLEI